LIEADLRFHLHLLELSGNPVLVEHGRRLLIPLFAFVLMRVETQHQGVTPWSETLTLHQRILEHLRGGDPFLTEQLIVRTAPRFATVAYDIWEQAPGKQNKPGGSHRKNKSTS
jgi:DNA-binding FadR family transcriptional regulator